MCDCDFNRPEMYEEKDDVVARKDHKCCECQTTIHKGEKHHSASGKWDHGFETFHTCLPCAERRRWHTKNDVHSCGPCFGELRQWEREQEMYANGQVF